MYKYPKLIFEFNLKVRFPYGFITKFQSVSPQLNFGLIRVGFNDLRAPNYPSTIIGPIPENSCSRKAKRGCHKTAESNFIVRYFDVNLDEVRVVQFRLESSELELKILDNAHVRSSLT